MMRLKPSEIFYTQDSIRHTFTDGKYLGKTFDNLYEERISVDSIPTIEVAKKSGKWYSNDNRRLWVFHRLEGAGKCKDIPVHVVSRVSDRKFTTKDGKCIFIRRHADPGGKHWRRITPVTPHSSQTEEPVHTVIREPENPAKKLREALIDRLRKIQRGNQLPIVPRHQRKHTNLLNTVLRARRNTEVQLALKIYHCLNGARYKLSKYRKNMASSRKAYLYSSKFALYVSEVDNFDVKFALPANKTRVFDSEDECDLAEDFTSSVKYRHVKTNQSDWDVEVGFVPKPVTSNISHNGEVQMEFEDVEYVTKEKKISISKDSVSDSDQYEGYNLNIDPAKNNITLEKEYRSKPQSSKRVELKEEINNRKRICLVIRRETDNDQMDSNNDKNSHFGSYTYSSAHLEEGELSDETTEEALQFCLSKMGQEYEEAIGKNSAAAESPERLIYQSDPQHESETGGADETVSVEKMVDVSDKEEGECSESEED